jgi:hypothetical protein
LEFELGAGFEGACGFALVLALSQMREHGLSPFICTRAGIHLIGRVVSLRSRAAMASLPGSLRRRVANSDSGQPRRASSSAMMRLALCSAVSRWSSPEWLAPSLPSISSSICSLNVSGMGGAFLNRPWRPETQINV